MPLRKPQASQKPVSLLTVSAGPVSGPSVDGLSAFSFTGRSLFRWFEAYSRSGRIQGGSKIFCCGN